MLDKVSLLLNFLKKNIFLFSIFLTATFLIVAFPNEEETKRTVNVSEQIQHENEFSLDFWGNNYFGIEPKEVGGLFTEGLTAYSPSIYRLDLDVKNHSSIEFSYGLVDQVVNLGDGVIFKIKLKKAEDENMETLFEDRVSPPGEKIKNKIRNGSLNLSSFKGEKIFLYFITEPNGNNAFDQAFWADVKHHFYVPIKIYNFTILLFAFLLIFAHKKKLSTLLAKNKFPIFFMFFILFTFVYFYLFTQGTYKVPLEFNQGGYYNWLAGCFYKGELGENFLGEYGGGDFSYFEGQKFLYFGPLPAIIHLIFYKIYFQNISGGVLTLIFSFLNLATFWLILNKVFDKHFSSKNDLTKVAIWISYASGTLMFCVARSFIYEESIILGSTFLLMGTYFFLAEFYKKYYNRSAIKIFLASFFFALAFTSRYNLILFYIFPFVLFFADFLFLNRYDYRQLLKISFVFISPLILGVALLFSYNYLRFQNIFEFGINYQQPGDEEILVRTKSRLLTSLDYIPYNIYDYFISLPSLKKHRLDSQVTLGEFPKLVGSEYVSSVLLNIPILFFVFYLFLLWTNKKIQLSKRCRILLAGLSLSVIALIGYLLTFAGSSRRYIQDFLPFSLIIALFGLEIYFSKIKIEKRRRRFVFFLVLILIYTFIINFGVSCNFAFRGDMGKCLNLYNKEYIPLN